MQSCIQWNTTLITRWHRNTFIHQNPNAHERHTTKRGHFLGCNTRIILCYERHTTKLGHMQQPNTHEIKDSSPKSPDQTMQQPKTHAIKETKLSYF